MTKISKGFPSEDGNENYKGFYEASYSDTDSKSINYQCSDNTYILISCDHQIKLG